MSWTDASSVPPPPKTGGDILRGAPKWVQILLMTLAAVWVVMVLAMLLSGSFNLFGFVIQLPLLTAITVPIARRIARSDRDPEMFWFVMAGFAAKIIGGLVRYYFTYVVYVSAGDAEEYDAFGHYLVPYYRSLNFSPDVGQVPGTGFMKFITGVLYSIVGSSKLGAFMVFAWLGFIGLAAVLARVQSRGPVRRRRSATRCSSCSCPRCSTGPLRWARTHGRSWGSGSARTASPDS